MQPEVAAAKAKATEAGQDGKYVIGLQNHAATVLKSLIIELVEEKCSKHRGIVQKKMMMELLET
jgi:hypothetical protein